MTKSTTESNTSTSGADLQRLTQSQVAYLVRKPPVWLRDNSQRFLRDENGRYDARQVLEAMQEIGPEVAELEDVHLEPMLTWLYSVTNFEGQLTGCLRVLQEITDQHGTSGLAAIGQIVWNIAKDHLRHFPEPAETAESIRARRAAEAEREIVGIEANAARRNMRIVSVCDVCKKYRWGRKWLKQPLPSGYVIGSETRCDECEETANGPRTN